jgi:4-amino-4-deoxy-L-arabinose transferase-like glycosyltransferase
MNIDNPNNNYDLDKLLNNYFVALILIVVNITLYFKFGDKFGDIFIDVSREVTVPLRILDGQIIYKDFHYEYGPFVPYYFAAIYKLFGTGLESLRLTGLATSATISFLIFRFSSHYINRKYALLSSIIFIFIFAFHSVGVNIFNYIFPYSYTSIFGVLFLLLLYSKAYNYYVYGNKTELISLVVVFSICMLTKLEIILSAVTLIILLLFIIYNEKKRIDDVDDVDDIKSELITSGLILYTVIFLCLIPIIIICIYYSEIIEYVNNEIFHLIKKNLNNPIGRGALGIDNFIYNLTRSGKSVVFFIFYGIIFFCLDIKTSKNNRYSISRLLLFLIILIISAFYVYAYGYNYLYFGTSIFLILFLFYLLLIICYRRNYKNKKDKLMLIVTVSSLTLTFRMIFNNTVEFYGFYLLVPASVCIVIAIFYYIPLFVRFRFKRKAGFFKCAFIVYFTIMCFSAYSNTSEISRHKNKILNTDKGLFYVYDYQYFSIQSLLNDFKGKLKSNDTILVLPEGYMLNYFLGVTPTSFNNSHIPDLMEGDREKKLIEEIKLKKFDYVIIVPRYTIEWGLPVLGRDYLQNTVEYIYQKYEPVLLYGDLPFSDFEKFGILVLKLK